ncbi:MAG: hypothetical protein JW836_11280 [Deltaproteobacteria bacterium]|nr:hypothetical protein [Deltaproteobacteria bacterium]
MEIPEVQPFLRLSSILQWLVVVLVFLAGTLQIAKMYIDKRIERTKNEIVGDKLAGYERTIADLTTRVNRQIETKQVTTEKPKERQIPADMVSKARAELSKFKGATMRLACDKKDKEALSFAEQLQRVFKEAGWTVVGINQVRHPKPVKEVVIILNHEEQRQKATYIFSLLMALDIKSTARLNKNQQEDLGIIVGQRE